MTEDNRQLAAPSTLAAATASTPAVAARRRRAGLAVLVTLVGALGCLCPLSAPAERIKDLANIQGVRPNQLIGYGLVVGLDGSGDQTTQTPFTVQSLQAMLSQLGVNLPPGTSLQLKNVAAVMVTAQLPPFAQPGQQFDVTVSSLGNAKSLRGGTLLLTSLKGVDGQLYALAQGNVAVGGAGASAGGSKTVINHLSAGRIPAGATVERAVPATVGQGDFVYLELRDTDFGTARQVTQAINAQKGDAVATAVDGRTIRVRSPLSVDERVAFISQLEEIDVVAARPAARVVLNSRSGVIVANTAVTLEACAVAAGNLTVTVDSQPVISQPNAFSQGQTVVAEQAQIQIKQDGKGLSVVPAGAKLADVVKALNTLGATPGDLLSILQAMKSAGALKAELEVI
jgi:flagellar P-ring protein precursor FlgI